MASVRQHELHTKVYDIFSAPKALLKTKVKLEDFPLSGSERFRLSKSMSVTELLTATDFHEDEEAKPRRRWREIQHLFKVTRDARYSKVSLENALWFYVYNGVSATHFSNAIIDEFAFPAEMRADMDAHLKWLYWSFDGGTDNKADWRTIVATFRIVIFFRLVQRRPVDLLISCFDIYAMGGESKTKEHPNDAWFVDDAVKIVTQILTLPGETLGEIFYMRNKVREAFLQLYRVPNHFHETHKFGVHVMYRREFRQFLRNNELLVRKFQEMCWARIPVELRLTYHDEEQAHALQRSDVIMTRYKVKQAYAMYDRSLKRGTFLTWQAAARRNSVVSFFIRTKFMRRRRGYFRFWRSLVAKTLLRRRRKVLAEVMGNYALKSRTFGRIRIYNYQTRYIFRTVGRFNRNAKWEKHAFMHLRSFVRLVHLRKAFHRWWHETMFLINWDMAVAHDWARRMLQPMVRWQRSAHYDAMNKRIEFQALENKMAFDRMMAAADEQALEIIRIEKDVQEKQRIQIEAAEVLEKERLKKEAKERAEKARQEEERVIINNQRDLRRKRVKGQMKKIKQTFLAASRRKYMDLIASARRRVESYVSDPSNEMAIEMRLEKLKREFLAPPTPETAERERILTSHKNIVFLYLDAKLRKDGLDMAKVVFKFDKEKRGFLTYDEFKNMIKALGVKLNPSQINAVIKGVDADGDGAVDLKELEDSMKDIEKMGVVGSPWKMYVDPAQDVICYHNFDDDRKIFEYQMKDEIYKEINQRNMFAEFETDAKRLAEESKKHDWEDLMRQVMARRMQFMYKQWKLRKRRKAKLWAIQTQIAANRRKFAIKIVNHCTRLFLGSKARASFVRQLRLAWQKVFNVQDGRMFWYNHHLKQSVWERPHLLWRYGDVPLPQVWVPIDVPVSQPAEGQLSEAGQGAVADSNTSGTTKEQMYALHYWHVKAKRDLPRKPDGLPLCATCHRNLADMRCVQCAINNCFACYRSQHASPLGFLQRARPTPDQAQDMDWLTRLKFSKEHCWEDVVIPRCHMCKSDKRVAGMHCPQCGDKDMCRTCCRRLHEHTALAAHEFYPI